MATAETTPFLANPSPSSVRAQSLRQAARMIRLVSTGRRGMSEPSVAVRETAAQEIEGRQVDWAHSSPVFFLDVAWNTSFVVAAVAALSLTHSHSPLRIWAAAYALQCVLHVFCVSIDFRRRRQRSLVSDDDGCTQSSVIRHLESANTMFSFIWWMIGFYWICVGSHALQQDSPILYWLCIVFLVLDLFFVMFCVALASVIAAAVCCCLPCIIAILYVLADRGGASKEEIELLPKYKFRRIGGEQKVIDETAEPCEGIMTECEVDHPTVRRLTVEDAECCICLSPYEDGAELRDLPCRHHFHANCVDKWLYINSTCPLCKFDISKRFNQDNQV